MDVCRMERLTRFLLERHRSTGELPSGLRRSVAWRRGRKHRFRSTDERGEMTRVGGHIGLPADTAPFNTGDTDIITTTTSQCFLATKKQQSKWRGECAPAVSLRFTGNVEG